jgi:hypothetical protein
VTSSAFLARRRCREIRILTMRNVWLGGVPGRGRNWLARAEVLKLGDLESKVLVSTVDTRESGDGDEENPERNRAFAM